MPVHRDTGKGQQSNSANGAAGSSTSGRQRETELKRLKGEISCAECRRLKLKCDKKVPCSSCTRRGCQTICPLGELLGGQGGRLVLADTDELHKTISEMSKRIRQLEDALQIEHGMRSVESHPLLREELLSVKKGLERHKSGINEEVDSLEDEREDIQNAMGLLTISEGGGARYLGITGSEQALLAEAGINGTMLTDDAEPLAGLNVSEQLNVPEQLIQASQLWPFRVTYGSTAELHALVEAQLPSRERASGLSESFLMNLSWFSRPVTREQIMEELLPMAYKRLPDSSEGLKTKMDLHDLALLLMVFATGAAADLTLPPLNEEAEKYRHLARAALGLKSIFDGGSMSAVQAICLLGAYDVASGRKHSMESAWKMMCLAFSLSASIGLHRDPARWHLDPKIIHRRRLLFWEMCWVDNWKSLSTGRPTSFTPDVIDCEFPEDLDAVIHDDGTKTPSLWAMKNMFAKQVLSGVAIRLCAAHPPKYSEILEMDRVVREFDMKFVDQSPGSSQVVDDYAVFARQSALVMFRDLVLLYIHRNYFARALLDHPNNPLRSPFAPSFLAAYRSATSLLRILRQKFVVFPHVFLRHWPTWAHALAASVVVGSVVTRSPGISLAPAAFVELELAVKLFETASVHPIVRQGVPILMRMYERAKTALEKVKSGDTITTSVAPEDVQRLVSSIGDGVKEENCEHLLNILRGSTRTRQQKNPPNSTPPQSNSGNSLRETPCPYSAQNTTENTAVPTSAPEPVVGQSTEDLMSDGDTDSLSPMTRTIGAMQENPAPPPTILGTSGSLVYGDMPPAQSSATAWPSVLSAGDYGDQIMQDILSMEIPGWQSHMLQDQPSFPTQQQQGAGSNPMNAATVTADGQSDMPYFPLGGIDFSNLEHLNLVSGYPTVPSSSGSSSSSQQQQQPTAVAPPANGNGLTSFLSMAPGSFPDFPQGSPTVPEVGSSLPLVDGDNGSSGQRVGDPWQSFMSDSGFETADELMRNWQVY